MSVDSLLETTDLLARQCQELSFEPPVACVYNPLIYAWEPYRRYVGRYARPGVKAVLVGMNPGPWGMCQTGIPFGDVSVVRDWLGIEAPVEQPAATHAKRPIQGFECTRGEVSGKRLWGWARDRFGDPASFFKRCFVVNYCPLAFLEASGRNRTPDKLPAAERQPLIRVCDAALRAEIEILDPEWILGIGRFAQQRLTDLFDGRRRIGSLPHPSPANPAANRGWAQLAERALSDQGITL